MLTSIGARARAWAAAVDPWTNVYGLARTLLALGTATTLAANDSSILFMPSSAAQPVAPVCEGVRGASAFCAAHGHLDLARLACVAVLLVVASGWRPRITGILHWYVAFSLQASATLLDGGDHVTEMLTLLLLPVTLTDARTWHWSKPSAAPSAPIGPMEEAKRIVALVSLFFVRLQVAGIYFHAAAGKFASESWGDGTSIYYWLSSSDFGAPPWLAPIVHPLLVNPVPVSLLTWGTVMLEFSLAAAIVMPRSRWRPLLWAGLSLHAGIILVHGLVSFGTAMFAALVLYLRPIDEPFALRRIALPRFTSQRMHVMKTRFVTMITMLVACVAFGAGCSAPAGGASTTEDTTASQGQALDGEQAFRGVYFGQGVVGDRLADMWSKPEFASARTTVDPAGVDALVAHVHESDPAFFDRFAAEVSSGDYARARAALLDGANEIRTFTPTDSKAAAMRAPCLIVCCAVVYYTAVIFSLPADEAAKPGLNQDTWVRTITDALDRTQAASR